MFKQRTIANAIVIGGLAGGMADFLYANIFYFAMFNLTPIRLWQNVAMGVLGKDAANSGIAASLLGVVCHFSIAQVMAACFVLVSRKLQVIARYPLAFGPLYGVFLYYAMSGIVLPYLSRVPGPPDMSHFPMVGKNIYSFVGGLLIHAFGVGLPIAWFASRVTAENSPASDSPSTPATSAPAK